MPREKQKLHHLKVPHYATFMLTNVNMNPTPPQTNRNTINVANANAKDYTDLL